MRSSSSILTTAACTFLLLAGASSAAYADALPSCPPGQRMDCHPANHHHGCSGCVDIEPEVAAEETPEDAPVEPVVEEPSTAETAHDDGEDDPGEDDPGEDDAGGGGCSAGMTASLGALWVLTPFVVVFGASRIRRRR